MFVRPEQCDGGTGFREAVSIGESSLRKERKRSLDELRRHAAAAIGDGAHCGYIRGGAGLPSSDDSPQHRRHQKRMGRLLGCGEPQPVIGIERREEQNPPHRIDRAQQGSNPGDVVGRYAHQRGFLLGSRTELDGTENVGEQVGMPQERRLRSRRGPAGEELNRDPVRRLIRARDGLGRRCGGKEGGACLVSDGRGPGSTARCAPRLPRYTRALCASAGIRGRDRQGDS